MSHYRDRGGDIVDAFRWTGDADQQEYRRFILPISCAVEEAASNDAVAQDCAGGDQRNRGKNDHEVVEDSEPTINRRDKRVVCRGGWEVALVLSRAVHYAGTSLASFNRFAAVADFLL